MHEKNVNILSHAQCKGYIIPYNQCTLSPITLDSLQEAINFVKPLKAPVLDGIVNAVIKKNARVLKYIMHVLTFIIFLATGKILKS